MLQRIFPHALLPFTMNRCLTLGGDEMSLSEQIPDDLIEALVVNFTMIHLAQLVSLKSICGAGCRPVKRIISR